MKFILVLSIVLLTRNLKAQAPASAIALTGQDVSTAKLVFSEPNLDSPIQMPSVAMGGPPVCGPDGVSFVKFLTPPPYYNKTTVYSVSSDGRVVHYPTESMMGLQNISPIFLDPGVTNAVFLLRASSVGESARSADGFYLALFDYDGELRHRTKLDLGFDPVEVVQLSSDRYLASGADPISARPRFALIDDTGIVRHNLNDATIMPSENELSAMVSSMNFVGMDPNQMAPAQKVSAMLSLFRPVHSVNGILILQPGAQAHVVEVLKSGEMRTVKLKLPANQVAQSIIVRQGSWFVRTSLRDNETASNFIQVDPESGQTMRTIEMAGVPATSIACPNASGFYGFRWIDHKPYIISANLK